MARRSQRLSSDGGTASKHKRAASGSTLSPRSRKKAKGVMHTTGRKSQFFGEQAAEHDGVSDVEDQEEEEVTTSPNEETGSEFGDAEEESALSKSEGSDDDDDHDSGEDATPKKAILKTKGSKGGEVWRTGVKTGLGPGHQVVIKKPKARPAGKTPYTDATIHPNTMLFLAELKENNDREWLKMHDADFRQGEKDWHSFVQSMTQRLIEVDDTIPELPVKDVIFRIYRDIRFSKDPTPYKPWFSVAWSRTGRKSSYAHYYVQIAPNKSFVGGGLWQPDSGPMNAIRTAIDQNSRRLKDVLKDTGIRKEFLGNSDNNDKAAVKAFVKSNEGNALKTKPKGFDGDHPNIDLLRLRNFTLGKSLKDEEVLGEAGVEKIANLLACLQPFVTYCNSIVMPDEEEEEEEDDEEDGEEDEEDDTDAE